MIHVGSYDDPIVRFQSFVPETTIRTKMNTNKISATLSAADQATALDNILANDTLLALLASHPGNAFSNRKHYFALQLTTKP